MNPRDYSEKRDFIRMAVGATMSFKVRGSGEHVAGVAKDLSASGLSIICDKALSLGDVLEVNVTPEHSVVPPLDALVEVVRVDDLGDGSYELGTSIVEFIKPE